MLAGEIAQLDGLGQAALISKGEVTALELVEAAIGRIERLNERLNAVISKTFEKARDQAVGGELVQGPFSGGPLPAEGSWSAYGW